MFEHQAIDCLMRIVYIYIQEIKFIHIQNYKKKERSLTYNYINFHHWFIYKLKLFIKFYQTLNLNSC